MEYTEKEKDAIRNLKNKIENFDNWFWKTDVKTVLFLIEKYECLFNGYKILNEKKEECIEKDFIPKEKIKNKIKELNDNRPYLSKFDDWKEKEYTNEDIIDNCVQVLEELLDE